MPVNKKSKGSEETVIDNAFVIAKYKQQLRNIKITSLSLKLSIFLGLYVMAVTLVFGTKAGLPVRIHSFASDGGGGVERITGTRYTRINDMQALRWAKDKTTDLLSLHFIHFRTQIIERANFFLDDAYKLYTDSLVSSKTIESIIKESLIVTAAGYGDPRLINKFKINGQTNWYIELQVLQTIQGASDKNDTNVLTIGITIQEVSRRESIDGLKIRTFNVIN